MLQTVSQSSAQVTASGASQQLADAWGSKVLPLCQEAFDRYPFIAGSTQDVPLDDFIHLLGPNGLMDQFFDQYLKPFVDTSQMPWNWQSGDHTKLGLSDGRADRVPARRRHPRRAVPDRRRADLGEVPAGAGASSIPVLAQVSIEMGGQRMTYAHGPIEPTAMQWPGSDGKTQVRLTMTPPAAARRR